MKTALKPVMNIDINDIRAQLSAAVQRAYEHGFSEGKAHTIKVMLQAGQATELPKSKALPAPKNVQKALPKPAKPIRKPRRGPNGLVGKAIYDILQNTTADTGLSMTEIQKRIIKMEPRVSPHSAVGHIKSRLGKVYAKNGHKYFMIPQAKQLQIVPIQSATEAETIEIDQAKKEQEAVDYWLNPDLAKNKA